MKRRTLSDTYLKSLKPAPSGQRYEVMDTQPRRFGVRVTDKVGKNGKADRISFIYFDRFPGSKNPTRRQLGVYPDMSLAEARDKAVEWGRLLAKDIDPADERLRVAAERAKAKKLAVENVLAVHAAKYLDFAKDQRQHRETARVIEKELLPLWGDRPIDSITPAEVKEVIIGVANRSPSMARNVLTVCKSFFDWALDEASPAAPLRPKKIIGKKKPRQRLLSDDEVRAFWNATATLDYPYRDLYRLLLFTGVRLREAADAKWSEFDLDKATWRIPPERFKSDAWHFVPLTAPVTQILESLPHYDGGDYLFSHTFGKTPINSFSKSKARLDAAMVKELGKAPPPFVIHDLRRVVRSGLASLKIPDTIAEMILGHGRSDVLKRTYDLHTYETELREGLELWAGRVRDIVTPPDPKKVTRLRKVTA